METNNFIVKKGSGKNTILDKAYSELINDVLQTSDDEKEGRWETYNLIIKELFKVDDGLYFQEIKYRFTDGENPNSVILNILSRYDTNDLSSLVWILSNRVQEYAEEDFFQRFCI